MVARPGRPGPRPEGRTAARPRLRCKGAVLARIFANPNLPAYFTLAVLAPMFAVFVARGLSRRGDGDARGGGAGGRGIVPSEGVLKVFSNPAPWTIAAMFIVSGGLVRTGLINGFARIVSRRAAQNKVLVLCAGGRSFIAVTLGLHQQHAAGRGDDPGDGAARARHGAGAVEAADPAVLS